MAAVLAFTSHLDPSRLMKPQDSMTPMSQVSTAANTPAMFTSNGKGGFQLPSFSSDDDLFELPSGFNEEATPFAVCLPNLNFGSPGSDEAMSLAAPVLQSELGCWARQQVEAEEWLVAERGQKVTTLTIPELQSDLARWAQRSVEAEMWLQEQRRVRGFAPITPKRSRDRARPSNRRQRRRVVRKAKTLCDPILESDLGRWAESIVKADEWLEQARIDHAVHSAGTLKLMSDLGQWAAKQVAAEEWLDQQWQC
jgi:hypothetical protein